MAEGQEGLPKQATQEPQHVIEAPKIPGQIVTETSKIGDRNKNIRDFEETQKAWEKEISWLIEKQKEGVYTQEEVTKYLAAILTEQQMNSERDPLTRLLKRNAFEEAAKGTLAHAIRKNEEMTVAILDLDHFKSVNDTFGHEAGDNVLRAVAQYLRSGLRDDDLVARWGGEEIVLALPTTSQENAVQVLQMLLTHLPENVSEILKSINAEIPREITASMGFADLSTLGQQLTHDDDKNEILKQLIINADDALYEAKGKDKEDEQGRDRAVYKKDGAFIEVLPQRQLKTPSQT